MTKNLILGKICLLIDISFMKCFLKCSFIAKLRFRISKTYSALINLTAEFIFWVSRLKIIFEGGGGVLYFTFSKITEQILLMIFAISLKFDKTAKKTNELLNLT